MTKFLKYTEYLYLIVAVMSIYKVISIWPVNPKDSYIFIFFGVVSIAMFLFRRNYRIKFQKRKEENQE